MFFCFFLFFPRFFPSTTKYQTTVLGNGWTDLPNDSGENGVCIAVPKWGLGPRLIFLGAKNYTLRTWWWRLASDWELVCWLWHCAATAVALKRHGRVNAFNLVDLYVILCTSAGPNFGLSSITGTPHKSHALLMSTTSVVEVYRLLFSL